MKNKSILSMFFGIGSMLIFPLICGTLAIVFGLIAKPKKKKSIVGIILGIIAIVLRIIYAFLFLYLR